MSKYKGKYDKCRTCKHVKNPKTDSGMKAILMSIRPKWCELIINNKKTIEVRKTKPKIKNPFKVYIYCTKSSKSCQTVCGSIVLNDDELYKHPQQGVKYGNSIELMGCDDYGKDNFLNGKVIGEFVCDSISKCDIDGLKWWDMLEHVLRLSCLEMEELQKYVGNDEFYGWHISDLKIYDKPKGLSVFNLTRPPQSWYYIKVSDNL